MGGFTNHPGFRGSGKGVPRAKVVYDAARLTAELRKDLDEVVRQVDEVIHEPRPAPASLHRLHRDMRRLQTALSIWEELLGATGRVQLHPLAVRYRRLTRLVGQVRDRDVALDLLESVEDVPQTDEEAEELRQYRRRLEDDARTGRELLRAFLRSERQARLFDLLGETFELKTRAHPGGSLAEVLTERQQRGRDRVVSAHKKARRDPSMDRLHRLRIRVRRLRQTADLAAIVDPLHDSALSDSLRRIQQHLGRLHDLDVLIQDLDPSLRETSWALALREERRRQRKTITKVLEKRKARHLPGAPKVRAAPPAARRPTSA